VSLPRGFSFAAQDPIVELLEPLEHLAIVEGQAVQLLVAAKFRDFANPRAGVQQAHGELVETVGIVRLQGYGEFCTKL